MELELKTDSINLMSSINDLELSVRQLKATCGIHNTGVEMLSSPLISMSEPVVGNSLFIQSYKQDSLTALNQQKIFNDQYRPQVNVFANSGLNSTSIPLIQRHVGMSAGVNLSYTIFDGRQKKINEQQQLLFIDEAATQKELKLKEVKSQLNAYLQTINKTKAELQKEKLIQTQYSELLDLYREELRNAQISIIDFIAYLKKYSDINLTITLKEITLNNLINEYNYWNN